MENWQRYFLTLLFFLSAPCLQAFQEKEDLRSIYVSSLGWHTGIVIPAEAFPDSLWIEGQNYADAQYLEIGWGDADFFTQEDFNLWFAIKAVLWPTPSAIQIKPVNQKAENYYSNTNMAKLEINEKQLQSMIFYVVNELKLDDNGKVIPVEDVPENFYKSSSYYYFPRNSNVWAARALKRAGFAINPFWYQTTGQVVRKAGKMGTLMRKHDQ